MTFWIVSIALTAAAALAVALPLFRKAPEAASGPAYDREVYRDQLDEIDRDVARGAINEDQAELARAEIARRLISADKAAEAFDAHEATRASGTARALAFAAILSVPVVGWGIYASIGSPGEPDQPLAARMAKSPEQNSVAELVARAENHLKSNPQDVRGWEVLAPIYVRLGRFDEAVNAFRNAIRLDGESARRYAGIGEALVGKEGGRVTDAALNAFQQALKLDPGDARARFYLATAKAQRGDIVGAAEIWSDLKDDLPQDSAMHQAVMQALAETQKRLGTNAPGPTREQVQDASQMTAQDRKAMIETMVAGLDEKLRDNPQDMEGWKRLVRSYIVLERPDDARAAVTRAVSAFGQGSDKAGEITAFARSLGLEEASQ